MATLGLIARADDGGLGTQTFEAWRHLRPDLTVVVDMGRDHRGRFRRDRYPGAHVAPHPLDTLTIRRLQQCDVVFTVEVPYRDDLHDFLRSSGTRLAVQLNPELLHPWLSADIWMNPTSWNPCRAVPSGAVELPVPVALDRLPFRRRDAVRTILHVPAPAMADRNGTESVIDAIPHIRSAVRLIMHGGASGSLDDSQVRRIMNHVRGTDVTVEFTSHCDEYWQVYRDDVDALLLPRRYGGLCLPLQEAAACGIVPIMLDIPPQHAWLPPHCRVPALSHVDVRMAGGRVPVYTVDSRTLAAAVDDIVSSPAVGLLSEAVHDWAGARSWERLLPRYRDALGL